MSSNNFKNCFLSSLEEALKNFLYSGNTLSISLSINATFSSAKLVSLIDLAFCCCFAVAISSGLVPLNLKIDASLSKALSNLELLYASSFPLFANAFALAPTPYTKGASSIDSDPNLTLFSNLLDASSATSVDCSLSNSVGPASNRSPNVPIFSLSTTNTSPRPPPTDITPNLFTPVSLFN